MPEWQCHIPEMVPPLAPKRALHFDRNRPSTCSEIRKYALLIAGDQDYLPLVEEMQRRRLAAYVAFFENGLGPRLKAEADFFFPLERALLDTWDEYLFPPLDIARFTIGSGQLEVTLRAKRVDPNPALFHEKADHLRLALSDHTLRVQCDSEVGARFSGKDQNDLKDLVLRHLGDVKGQNADFFRNALS